MSRSFREPLAYLRPVSSLIQVIHSSGGRASSRAAFKVHVAYFRREVGPKISGSRSAIFALQQGSLADQMFFLVISTHLIACIIATRHQLITCTTGALSIEFGLPFVRGLNRFVKTSCVNAHAPCECVSCKLLTVQQVKRATLRRVVVTCTFGGA